MGLLAGGLGLIDPCKCGDLAAGFIDLEVDLIVCGDAFSFLKDKVNSLMQEKEGLMREAADLRQEVSNLKANHNLIRELFSMLLRLPMVVEAIRKSSQEAWELFEKLVSLFELPSIASPPSKPKRVDGTSAGEPQGLLKAGNSPNRKKPNDDMTQNI